MSDYSDIDNPFDDQLARGADTALTVGPTSEELADQSETSAPAIGAMGSSGSTGDVEQTAVKSPGALDDVWINTWIKSYKWQPKKSGFYLDGRTGYAEFSDIFISGGITATTGTIGGFSIGSDYIRDTANSMGLASTVTGSDDVRFWAGDTYANRATAPFTVKESGLVTANNIVITGGVVDASVLNGLIDQANLDVANQGWNQTCTFSASDSDTVAWSSGTFTSADGTSYSINASNTGNMAARTYIYFNPAVDANDFLTTTTAATAVGAGKVLIGTAVNGTTEARFQIFNGAGGINVDGANVVPGTITTTEIGLSTIQGANVAAATLTGSNIAAATIAAGNIVSGTITTTQIAATTIVAGNIAANTITAAEIAANTITAAQIAANTITASQIAAGTITANEIAASTITAGKMNVTQLSAIAADLGAITAGTIVLPSGGYIRSGQTAYDTGTGFYIGNDSGTPKLSLGNSAGNKLTWDGSSLTIVGGITSTTGTIGGFSIGSDYIRDAANSFGLSSTVTGGDDVRFWAGDTYTNRATAPFRVTEAGAVTANNVNITGGSLSIGSNSSIDSSGNATFIGVSSLNMKAYTNFETSGRFIHTSGGSGSASFGNQGATVQTGTTTTSYHRMLWWITNDVFANNPTFTCSILCLGGFTANDGVSFIGLGNPSIDGSGLTETGSDYCGFKIQKSGGVTQVTALQCDGSANVDFVANFVGLTDNDSIELYIKVTASNIKYYYRKNAGSLTLAATLSSYMPNTASNYIHFSSSNKGTSTNFQVQLQCAAYEH